MYKGQADAADPNFFESQRQTLCNWHLQDPVNEPEWNRTWLIAQYQSGKPNPFVLDCTLPERCYCAEFEQPCTPVATDEVADNPSFTLKNIAPNPIADEAMLSFQLHEPGRVRLEVFSAFGKPLDAVELGWLAAGDQQIRWTKKANMPSGLFLFRLGFENGAGVVGKAVVLP
jgi:hypothetical protein